MRSRLGVCFNRAITKAISVQSHDIDCDKASSDLLNCQVPKNEKFAINVPLYAWGIRYFCPVLYINIPASKIHSNYETSFIF